MGLGRLFIDGGDKAQTRSTRYTVSDTITGATAVYTVQGGLSPDWPSSDPYRGAMGIPGAWRASVMLADLLGQVPWDAYRKFLGQSEEMIEPRPPLLEQPSPPDTAMTTFSSWALDLIWHGNAVAVISDWNWAGIPTACVPVPADTVSVRRVPRDDPFFSGRRPGSIEYKVGTMTFGPEEVIHIKGPCRPGALRGMGVLETHFATLSLARDQQRQAQNITNHGVPTGVLKSDNEDLSDAEADDMKAKWMAARASGGIAVINGLTEFTPLSWNPKDLQLVEARQMTTNELELVFGLPVGWLGGMNSARQYSNIEQDAINLLKFSLGGHVARFEDTLSLRYPRQTVVRANLDAILRADILTRYKAYEIGVKNNWLLRREVRDKEHMPEIEEDELAAEAKMVKAITPKPAIPAAPQAPEEEDNGNTGEEGAARRPARDRAAAA